MRIHVLLQNSLLSLLLVVLIGFLPEAVQGQATAQVQKVTLSEAQQNFYKTEIEKLISVNFKGESLREALQYIANESGLKLTYRGDFLVNKNVTLKNEIISVSDALSHVLKNTGLDYKFSQEGYLLIAETEKILNRIVFQETVQGQVTNAQTDEPLPGVNIFIQGTSTGTVTDIDGNYSIEVPGQDAVLVVSYVGYVTQEIEVGDRNTIDVELNEDLQLLDDIVVTGYSAQARGDITGSIAVVDMDDMRTNPSGSAEQALQGQVSGVNVITSGSPGSRSNIFIRGVSNFGDTHPLVLVDGVEGDLNDIHPNDIESMQVLKDAGAASIYGVRGSNGVIVISTKKGRSGTPTINYRSSVGVDLPLPGNPYDIMTPENHMKVMTEVHPDHPVYGDGLPDYLWFGPTGGGVAFEGDPEVDPSLYHFDPVNAENSYSIAKANKEGTNWFQEVYNPAPVVDQNLSISGGSESATYFVALGHLNEQGTMLNTHLKRYSVRVNTDVSINDRIRFGQNLNVYHKDNPIPSLGRAVDGIFRVPRIIPKYDIGGKYAGPRLGGGYSCSS